MEQAERLTGRVLDGDVFVDLGYRKHDYQGPADIHISRTKKLAGRLRRLMGRRSAIEAKIGHMKNHSRLDRNFLLGQDGDAINALLCGSGVNLRLLIGVIYLRLYFLLFSVRQNLEKHARSTLAAYSAHHRTVNPPFGSEFSLY